MVYCSQSQGVNWQRRQSRMRRKKLVMLNVGFSCVLKNIDLGHYTIRVMYQEGHEKVGGVKDLDHVYNISFAVINNEDDTISYVDENIDWLDHKDENVVGAARLAVKEGNSILTFFDYLEFHMGYSDMTSSFNPRRTRDDHWGPVNNHLNHNSSELAEYIVGAYVYCGAMDDYTLEELDKLPELHYGTKWHLYPEAQEKLDSDDRAIHGLRLEFDRAVNRFKSGRYKQDWTPLRQPNGRLPEGLQRVAEGGNPKYSINLGEAEGGES